METNAALDLRIQTQRRTYRRSVLGCLILAVTAVEVLFYAEWMVCQSEASSEISQAANDSVIVRDSFQSLVERYTFGSRSRAVSSRFTTPDDTKSNQKLLLT